MNILAEYSSESEFESEENLKSQNSEEVIPPIENWEKSGEVSNLEEWQRTHRDDIDTVIKLPPIPSSVYDKYQIPPNTDKYIECTDNGMSLGAIKGSDVFKRNIGKWSCFLYIEYRPSSTEREMISKTLSQFNQSWQKKLPGTDIFEPLHYTTLGVPVPLHISLTKNIPFDSETQRDRFYNILVPKVAQLRQHLVQFEDTLRFYGSPQTTSVFLGYNVAQSVKDNIIKDITDNIESALIDSGLSESDKMVTVPSFSHMSIAKLSNAPKDILDKVGYADSNQMAKQIQDYLEISPNQQPVFYVSSIKMNKNRELLTIPFATP